MVSTAIASLTVRCVASSQQQPMPSDRRAVVVRVASLRAPPATTLVGSWGEDRGIAVIADRQAFAARPAERVEFAGELRRRVEDLMQGDVVVAHPDAPLAEAAALLDGAAGLPVVDRLGSHKLVGVITKRDLLKPGSTVKDVMRSPALAVKTGNSVAHAAAVMLEKGLDRVPVTDAAGRCVGVISRSDLFWALAEDSDSVRPH